MAPAVLKDKLAGLEERRKTESAWSIPKKLKGSTRGPLLSVLTSSSRLKSWRGEVSDRSVGSMAAQEHILMLPQ